MFLGLALLSNVALAQTYPSISNYTFAGTNPNVGGGLVAASVKFTVTASGAVTIDLSNTYTGVTANNTDVLEGILFDTTIATKAGTTAAGTWAQVATGSYLLDASGNIVGSAGADLSTLGNYKFANLGTGISTDGLVHNYGISSTAAYGISTGAGKGGIVSTATYPTGPGSAKLGSANKTPWTDHEAIFSLSGITGLTNVNQITNVYFIYSSAGTASVKATVTPEPGTLTLLGAAVITGGTWIRKRKRARR